MDSVGQMELSDYRAPGQTYVKEYDLDRLAEQTRAVASLMKDGQRRTLREIADKVGCLETSASARLRQLRNEYGWTVNRARRGDPKKGLFEYWAS
jgi:hypothetical protein